MRPHSGMWSRTVYQGVIIELTFEVAKNTGSFNDEIDFAGSEVLVSLKADPPSVLRFQSHRIHYEVHALVFAMHLFPVCTTVLAASCPTITKGACENVSDRTCGSPKQSCGPGGRIEGQSPHVSVRMRRCGQGLRFRLPWFWCSCVRCRNSSVPFRRASKVSRRDV